MNNLNRKKCNHFPRDKSGTKDWAIFESQGNKWRKKLCHNMFEHELTRTKDLD